MNEDGKLQAELLTNEPLAPLTPSTDKSHTSEPSSSKSKKSKSKTSAHDSRTHAPPPGNYYSHLMSPCPHCGCKRVRIVNPGRLDRRNIIECTNRECLATIKFTEAPEGILINPGVKEEFTWYDLDPEEIFYPSASTLKRLEERLVKLAIFILTG
ncbi:hypothetical protein OESDEN_08109 [Oesophagostomum dentatum]|uniref:Uncharacterized protein n=1 Tax=Oesophagostomum dentatum TaxID=61180 RepID=A0A0B1T453_OESDE|nr:hypothetical protein OESDEN_08109 [Oesophagostomum dentatum]